MLKRKNFVPVALIFGALSLAGCSKSSDAPKAAAEGGPKKMLYLSLDGFGVPTPGKADDAIQAHIDTTDETSFLNQVFVQKKYPMRSLIAGGECVGLPAGVIGNSEAGHNALCSGKSVPQRRSYIDTIFEDPKGWPKLPVTQAAAKAKAAGGDVHVVYYLSDSSSVGYYEHLPSLLELLATQTDTVYAHLLCDGYAKRSCRDIYDELVPRKPKGLKLEFLSVASSGQGCMGRDNAEAAHRCASAMIGREDAAMTSASFDTLIDQENAGSTLKAQRLTKDHTIDENDVIIFNAYRRDIAQGLGKALRGYKDKPAARYGKGPGVVTFGFLGEAELYQNDPKYLEAFGLEMHEGVFADLRGQGRTQARLSESKKLAHTTYFCDGRAPTDPDTFHFHPKSPDYREDPCGRTPDVVAAFKEQASTRDFVFMNLPNADLGGHTGDQAVAEKAVACLDKGLSDLIPYAVSQGFEVVVTADHGNADDMLNEDGSGNKNHSDAPVPFIWVTGPMGSLVSNDDAPGMCNAAAAGTVMDIAGIERPQDIDTLLK